MNVETTRQFVKDLKKLPFKVQQGVAIAYAQVESADTMHQIPNCKRLEGHEHYYRIRIGDYRVLLLAVITTDTVILKRVVPRGGAYKKHIQK